MGGSLFGEFRRPRRGSLAGGHSGVTFVQRSSSRRVIRIDRFLIRFDRFLIRFDRFTVTIAALPGTLVASVRSETEHTSPPGGVRPYRYTGPARPAPTSRDTGILLGNGHGPRKDFRPAKSLHCRCHGKSSACGARDRVLQFCGFARRFPRLFSPKSRPPTELRYLISGVPILENRVSEAVERARRP